MYTCPMHPEIRQEKPGTCPKCGMKLVLESETKHSNPQTNSYTPLIVVISLILLVTLSLTGKDFWNNSFQITKTIAYFMVGFFLVFSGFKLMDLHGFAEGYSTYDLLAQKWMGYGYFYPFVELGFGLSMILFSQNKLLLIAEFIIMAFSGVGVLLKIIKHERFQCACLGTFLKVPLTKVTLVEDFGMAFLAALLLILK